MSPRRGHDEWWEHSPRRPGTGPWRAGGRRPFGATWWGREWVRALEGRARLDPNRLPRGRTYARTGAVAELDLAPGEVRADVQGSRREPYQVRVRVRTWTPAEWDAVTEALASKIGHVAALFDGEIPPEVADDVHGAGLDLLPGPGELQPRCSCPDWADPCKHSAAVCYLVADVLDEDPFVLFLLRGREREALLAALGARRSTPGPSAALLPEPDAPDTGVVAVEAFRAWSARPRALPRLPPPPARPGRPALLVADPPPGSGIDVAGLAELVADAARRALELALGSSATGLELDEEEDLARRASHLLDPDRVVTDPSALERLSARSGRSARRLVDLGLAWRQGGLPALAALDGRVEVDPASAAEGRAILGPGARCRGNRVTLGDRQLRRGADGRWYPYRRSGSGWTPDGPPAEGAEGADASSS